MIGENIMKKELSKIELSGIRAFAETYRSNTNNLFMTIGEPDFTTPEPIKEAANQALIDNVTQYPHAMGLKELRSKIAKHENALYNTNYSEDNVIVTNGATESLALAIWGNLDIGDEVIVPVPSFPLYLTQAKLSGAVPVVMDTSSNDFQITKEDLDSKLTPSTKALLITTPNNPTGTIYSQESNQAMHDFMVENPDVLLMIDEVYRAMLFTDDYPSMREFDNLSDRIIVIQSFSKSHAMTGWRIGYLLAHESLIDSMHKLHQNMVTGITTLSQMGAIKALDIQMDDMVATFKKRSIYVSQRLSAMGLDFVEPQGALYAFFSIEKFKMPSLEFGERLASEANLILVPGIYFGTEGYMRLSFGLKMELLEEGLNRLQGFINKLD